MTIKKGQQMLTPVFYSSNKDNCFGVAARSSFNRFLLNSTCLSLNSLPIQTIVFSLQNFSQAIPVVPVPINGS